MRVSIECVAFSARVARPPKVTLLRPDDPAMPPCARHVEDRLLPFNQTAHHPLEPRPTEP